MNEHLLTTEFRIGNPEVFADEADIKAYVTSRLARELAGELLRRVPAQWSVSGREAVARVEAVVMSRAEYQQQLAFAEMRGRVSYREDYMNSRTVR